MFKQIWFPEMVQHHIMSRHGKEDLNSRYYATTYPDVYAAAERTFGSWGEAIESCGLFLNRLWDGSFSPVKTFTIFFPLLAGLADDDIKHSLKQSLLDPDQFWGGNFIPSVSKDDPAYLDSLDNGGNYWRGNCWPPVTYMCWLSAREAGWYDISAMIAEKVNSQFMEYWLKFGHSYENYPAEGSVDHSFIYPGGPWGGARDTLSVGGASSVMHS